MENEELYEACPVVASRGGTESSDGGCAAEAMLHDGPGHEVDLPAFLPHPVAPIDVLSVEEIPLLHPADVVIAERLSDCTASIAHWIGRDAVAISPSSRKFASISTSQPGSSKRPGPARQQGQGSSEIGAPTPEFTRPRRPAGTTIPTWARRHA